MRQNERKQQLKRRQKQKHAMMRMILCGFLLLGVVVGLKGLTEVASDLYASRSANTKKGIETASTRTVTLPVEKAKKVEKAKDKTKDKTEKQTKKEETKQVKRTCTVCVDPGHGGKDIGCNYENRKESEDVLKLALLVQKELQERQINVVMTRDSDTYPDLQERVAIANDQGADYFLSIHRNKADGYGVETWVNQNPSDASRELGQNVHNAIVGVGVQRDRGLKEGSQDGNGSYYVLRCSQMSACLVEMGFVNNSKDNELFDQNLEAYAKGIADAIVSTAEAQGKYEAAE